MPEITREQFKDKILSFVPMEYNDNIPNIILAVLDEAVDAVYDGRDTIDGRVPQTEQEMIYCVVQHMQAASNIYSGMVKGLKNEFPHDEININYRGYNFRP